MSDHWEEVSWDKDTLSHAKVNITWLVDGKVARLEGLDNFHSQVNSIHRSTVVATTKKQVIIKKPRAAFLVPMHGGIWNMCVSLTSKFF